MQASLFSLFMAIAFSSLYIGLVVLLGKRDYFIVRFGVHTIILLFALSIIRLAFSFDFLSSKIIRDTVVFPHIYMFLAKEYQLPGMHDGVSLISILLVIWIVVGIILVAKTVWTASRYCYMLRCMPETDREALRILAQKVSLENFGKELPCKIVSSSWITSPSMSGFMQPTILLPVDLYTEHELYDILLHELTHIYYRDTWTGLIIQLFCCVFWWNPLVYLLRAQWVELQEIRCDRFVVRNKSKEEKIQYCLSLAKVPAEKTAPPYGDTMYVTGFRIGAKRKNYNPDVRRINIMRASHGQVKESPLSKVMIVAVTLVLFFASYTFIVQPYIGFDETENTTGMIFQNSSYIVDNLDGTYTFYFNEGDSKIISEERKTALEKDGVKVLEK